jgi:ParB family transcriptional regulator, chromosome partitioning protein
MSRKTNLDALFGRRPEPKPADEREFAAANQAPPPGFAAANQPPAPLIERRRSGAVGAMSGALRSLAAQADVAATLQTGASVVELDTALIDDSFIADRVADANDLSLTTLVESVRESGQQVPVLVRPNPTAKGRYQIAYGRRRTHAARILERPVRAVIRPLTDAELVIAQGKENLERRDLSFIERAFFALRLEQHGFPRETITSAMGVGKGDLSSLISVAKTVPEDVLAAIGPAPAAGRPRWRDLSERICSADRRTLSVLLGDPAFQAKGTDERFAAVYAAVTPKPERMPKAETLKDAKGLRYARVERGATGLRVTVEEGAEPGFGDYLAARIPEILAAYRASKG